MPAIKSTGAYIPYYRLKREEIARAWGGGAQKGEKAVANFDEDSITLAVESARDCLQGIDRRTVDGLYFATTTSPYREKQCAAIVAAALGLKKNVFTADFTDSLRAGTNALRAALDALKAGTAQNILVIAADCRLGAPGSDFEQTFGDGSAALLVSSEGSVSFGASYTHASEIIDQWRTENQPFVKMWEDRFVYTQGYLANVKEALSAYLKENDHALQDYHKFIIYAPDSRRHQEACRMLKVDSQVQVQDPLFEVVGNTGAAFALMMLVAAIEEASAGQRMLLINYGDGCDLFALEVEGEPFVAKERKGVKGYLKSKKYLSYEKYLRVRKLLEVEMGRRRPPLVSSAVAINRDRKMIYSLHASECTNCGRAFFPPQRVCLYCRAKDQFREISFSERKGKLFNFCLDELAQSSDPPVIVSLVDVEGGLRFYGQMTDRDPEQIELDLPVEFTFRKMSEAEGFHNYFWKCRPIR
ncbi:MAG: zinc ribbon domain-containing protein [Bacillota bacterium]